MATLQYVSPLSNDGALGRQTDTDTLSWAHVETENRAYLRGKLSAWDHRGAVSEHQRRLGQTFGTHDHTVLCVRACLCLWGIFMDIRRSLMTTTTCLTLTLGLSWSLISTLKPSLNFQAAMWQSEDQPKCPQHTHISLLICTHIQSCTTDFPFPTLLWTKCSVKVIQATTCGKTEWWE